MEQGCQYQDLDDYDQSSVHLYLERSQEIIAYIRLIPRHTFYQEASFGRVIVKKEYRGQGFAKQLLQRGLQILFSEMNETEIKIQAEDYLVEFYQSFGFQVISDPYLDYGLLHIDMILRKDEGDGLDSKNV